MSRQTNSDFSSPELPSGTVTFLFTDIQGSTRLWQEYPQEMPGALEQHHALLYEAIETHHGYVFQIIGDAFCAAFDSAGEGLQASLAAQRAFRDATWERTGQILVRMALHTGPAEVRAGDFTSGEYVSGLTLSQASRLLSAGHGGQILVSRSTAELLQDNLPLDVTLKDMGTRQLKDLEKGEVIYQVVASDLLAEFPALKTLEAHPTNLPFQPTPFVGRGKELASLDALFADPHHRLVSILGAGGMGKTRLAIAAAERQLVATKSSNGREVTRFPDGVFFVPLAGLDSADNILSAIADSVGLQFYPGAEPKRQLMNFFHHKQTLLVMDNFEHLLEGATLLVEIMEVAPGVKILVTSREKLNLGSEVVFLLQGMRYPDEDKVEIVEIDQARKRYSALELFLQSAHRVCPEFMPIADEMKSIVRICRLVEGMPLGVELAGAWMEVLTPQEIADEIQKSLDFLATEQRDVPKRHQSIRAVFDYTWTLLSESQQEVFKKLSVFRGGFTREAAQEVTGISLLELRALANKSLLQKGSDGRYLVHELLRLYAGEKLALVEKEKVSNQHCEYYAEFLQKRIADIQGGQQAESLLEMDNIRAAWRWAVAHERFGAIRKSWVSLLWMYHFQGWFPEARALFEASEKMLRTGDSCDEKEIAYGTILGSLGWWLSLAGEYENGLGYLHQSQAILRKHGAQLDLAWVNLAVVARDIELTFDEQKQLLDEMVSISEELDAPYIKLNAIMYLGLIARFQGEYKLAEILFSEALQLSKYLNSHRNIAITLENMGNLAFLRQDYSAAQECYKKSLYHARTAGYKIQISDNLGELAIVALAMEDLQAAKEHLEDSLAMCKYLGLPAGIAEAIRKLGVVALEMDDLEEAEARFKESLAIFESTDDHSGIGFVRSDLGNLARIKGDIQETINGYRSALNICLDHKYDWLLVYILAYMVPLLEQAGEKGKAVELATMVVNHPECDGFMKAKTIKHLAKLKKALPLAVFSTAQERGQDRVLEATVEELLAVLENGELMGDRDD